MTELVPLSDVTEDLQSGFACGDSVNDGIVQLRMNNVDTEGSIDFGATRRVPRDAVRDVDRFLMVPGDVMFNNTNSPELVGKSAVFRGFHEPVVFSNHFTRIRVRRDRLEPRYLGRWLASEWRRGRFAGMCNQWVNQASVGKDALLSVTIPLPPLPEQRRIADVLDKADAIRRKRKEAIALTEELLRSAFLEMFGDPVTNPKGWPLVPLSRLGAITTGNTPSRAVPEYFGDYVEWIKSDNINTPRHYLTRATEGLSQKGRDIGRTVPAGSSLVTCIAGSPECIGNVALADREVAFNQQINGVTPKPGVDHRFLYVLLLVGKRLVQSASTNSMKGMVSKGKLEQVPFPSPDPPLQERFGDVFDRVVTLSRRLELSAEGSDELFDSMVARAFRGELTSPIGASARVAAGSP